MSLLQSLSWRTMLAGLTLTTLMVPHAWALDEDAQAAKDEGMRLYGIRRADTAIPYLEQAAEAGDVEAMYYLVEATVAWLWAI